MEIFINTIAKRYLYDWIFRNVSIHLQSSQRYAILGSNGSGKSSFLKIIAGHLSPTQGDIVYKLNDQVIPKDNIYQHLSFAAPYIDLIEEFTLWEAIRFHQNFKPFFEGMTSNDFLKIIELENAKHKEIRFFSSGMKQRLKLALAICTPTPLLLLDEPTATLDEKSILWYQNLLNTYHQNRLIIIASNEQRDIIHCSEKLNIMDFRKQ